MKISFSRLVEKGEIRAYVTKLKPEFMDVYETFFFVGMNYDLPGLRNSLLERIQRGLETIQCTVNRTSKGSLWVSSPDQFSLTLDALFISGEGTYGPRSKSLSQYDLNNKPDIAVPNVETLPKRNSFGLIRQHPIRVEAPYARAEGEVYYESLSAEPTPVLNVLNTLGFACTVVPTPANVELMLRELENRRK